MAEQRYTHSDVTNRRGWVNHSLRRLGKSCIIVVANKGGKWRWAFVPYSGDPAAVPGVDYHEMRQSSTVATTREFCIMLEGMDAALEGILHLD